ncbi:hypothetical protein V6N11_069715 [Hibiscus sabdariffa]|uniref:Uncharacterized protein n=1 Tax=Hibiscus sabdariffa TaxID=183260 RepID=A0ABR2Q3J9_9ROSI
MNEVNMSILSYGKNFIDTRVSFNEEEEWFLTFIYGPPYADEKREFWASLASLRNNRAEKWCLIGDSKIVARPEEKLGGLPFDHSNARSEEEAILEKLDRILVSTDWSSAFPKAIGVIDEAIASNHALVILLLKGMNKKYKRDFKFEAKWILQNECTTHVEES